MCLFLLYCILNTKNLEAWKFYVYFHVLGLRRVKKSEFVLRYNIALFAGHAIGANPAIPRMFPNMFPLVISQVYFCFFLPTLVMQCDVFSFISHILVSFLSCSYLCTPDMVTILNFNCFDRESWQTEGWLQSWNCLLTSLPKEKEFLAQARMIIFLPTGEGVKFSFLCPIDLF